MCCAPNYKMYNKVVENVRQHSTFFFKQTHFRFDFVVCSFAFQNNDLLKKNSVQQKAYEEINRIKVRFISFH